MKLAILGATGRIGSHLQRWALNTGHSVRSLARHPEALRPAPGLAVIGGDALDAGAVAEVIAGTDAVLSALGPRGKKNPGLLAGGRGEHGRGHGGDRTAPADLRVRRGPVGTGRPEHELADQAGPAAGPRDHVRRHPGDGGHDPGIRSQLDAGAGEPAHRRAAHRALPGRPRLHPARRRKISHFIEATLTDGGWLKSAPALAY